MNPLDKLPPREMGTLMSYLAKANPPPVVHRYRRPSDWTIKELIVPEVHIANVSDMNDPFEYRAPLAVDMGKLKTEFLSYCLKQGMDQDAAKAEVEAIDRQSLALLAEGYEALRKASGLICCSGQPRSNRMWAYYAEGHKGICVGYSTDFSPFCFTRKVSYLNPIGSLELMSVLARDPTILSDYVSCRKGLEWEFEDEFRLPVGPFPEEHTRLLPISRDAIVEIRLGANVSPRFKTDVLNALRPFAKQPRIIQMGCDYNRFELTENEVPIN